VDILMQAIEKKNSSGTYNLGYGVPSSIEEIYNYITMAITKKMDTLSLPDSNQTQVNSVVNFWSDNSKLENTFDTSKFHNLEAGLRKTIKLEFPH
jgi:nucleoside-diphosphate-sugar epimerase